jgi:formylglycine-generating enzyme required for sulfatase activity
LGEEEQQGVITLASCSPSERSYEIEALQQGSFTYALLEALRIQGAGNCATVERLEQRLRYRIPEINQAHRKPKQNPYAVVEPAFKYHLILLQNQATVKDVDTLKMRAYEAQNERNLVLAEQLWTRILAVSPADPQALKALQQIWTLAPPVQPVQPFFKLRGDKSAKSSPISPVLKSLNRPQVSTFSLSENKVFVNRRKILSLGGQGFLLIAGMAAIIPVIFKWIGEMITASQKPSEIVPLFPSSSKLVNYQETLPGGIKLDMVTLPAGSFLMGSSASDPDAGIDEKPQHQVKLNSFSIGKYSVTQEQYQAVLGKNPSSFNNNSKNPVEQVSWHDAQEFCKKLNQLTGKKYRLPTEAEWEYACRAGTQTRFYFGDDAAKLGDYGWYSRNSGSKTHPVGEKKPNDWGLYDMSGNVWEWCEDSLHDSYANKPENIKNNGNATWSSSNISLRVLRGGSWLDTWRNCRSASRHGVSAHVRNVNFGFRLAVSAF